MSSPLALLFLGGVCVLWAVLLWRSRREFGSAPRLPRLPEESLPEAAPLVSLLLPARDEADRMLACCVRSLLAQDYPHFEIIAVDDRSRDATGVMLRDLAREARGRMTVISGVELAEGWVGKQHALMQAARRARGEWLLTVDADALYEPDAVRNAVRQAETLRLDALSLLPRVGAGDFWVSIVYPIGFWALLTTYPLCHVNRQGTPIGIAWGGFLLLRRRIFEAVGGYEPVRAETSEDTKMAALLKRRGYRLRTEIAVDQVFTPMYPTMGELWRGTMKNVYAGPFLTPVLGIFIALSGTLPAVLGIAAALQSVWGAAALAGLAWTLQALTLVPVYRMHRIPAWRAVFAPLGTAISAAQMLRTTWLVAVTGQGIGWRGRRVRVRPPRHPAPPPPTLARRRSPR